MSASARIHTSAPPPSTLSLILLLLSTVLTLQTHTQFCRLVTHRTLHPCRHWQIMLSTGPTFIWKMVSDYEKLRDRPGRVTVDTMPAWVWGKCKICKAKCEPPVDGFLRHAQGDSWHHWDSWLFTHGIFCHVEFCICLVWALFLFVDKHFTRYTPLHPRVYPVIVSVTCYSFMACTVWVPVYS